MIEYNVTQIRTRLGSIMQKIYTEKYITFYNSLSATARERFTKKVPNTIDDTDTFIVLLANYLDDPFVINRLIDETDHLILFSLVIRYSLMTNFFVSIDQSHIYLMRESDKDFLLDALIRIFRDDYPLWIQSQ